MLAMISRPDLRPPRQSLPPTLRRDLPPRLRPQVENSRKRPTSAAAGGVPGPAEAGSSSRVWHAVSDVVEVLRDARSSGVQGDRAVPQPPARLQASQLGPPRIR